jgi:hypothetical protein
MNLTLKQKLDLQRAAKIITESQYKKLLKETEEPIKEMASEKSAAVSALKSEVQTLKGDRKKLATLAMSVLSVIQDIEDNLGTQDSGDIAAVYNDFYASIIDDDDEE